MANLPQTFPMTTQDRELSDGAKMALLVSAVLYLPELHCAAMHGSWLMLGCRHAWPPEHRLCLLERTRVSIYGTRQFQRFEELGLTWTQ